MELDFKVSKVLPKILVEISEGITMLDWLMEEYLPKNSKVILATGHLHKTIINMLRKKITRKIFYFPKKILNWEQVEQ